MRAVVCARYGPPEGLQLTDIPRPVPKHDEVLIRIHATTVTAGDVILRSLTGLQRVVMGLFLGGLGTNKILGHELAGEIKTAGEDVKRFKAGDPVFASTGNKGGAYAEYICLPENGMIAPKPTNMTYEEAAAVPVGANTALHLLEGGNIQRGQEVLIYGASGSVGTCAVQLAKHFGAEVTGVCSSSNVGLVKSLGADRVLDYTQEGFTLAEASYDVVFDAVRKLSSALGKKALKEDGTYLSVASSTKERPENLAFLKELIEANQLTAAIDRRYSLEQIVEAHRYVDEGHKKGNVVVAMLPSREVETGGPGSDAK